MQDYGQASAYIDALTGNNSATAIINWRCIHDQNKGIPAHTFRGTLAEHWQTLCNYNAAGYGIFAVVSEMDGNGNELANVQSVRAHYVDMDNVASAAINLDRAKAWHPLPSFAVQTSPNKYHVYWPVAPYVGNDRFQLVQRKLRQMFEGDKAVIDATRVMRLPGTFHCKGAPSLVTCFALPGYGYLSSIDGLEAALSGVNVIDGGGGRHELGDPSLAAPSLEWIKRALDLIDPDRLDRGEWISLTAAVKQAGWSIMESEQQLFDLWSAWCARYSDNDLPENAKQWNSIRNTETGWKTLVNRAPGLKGKFVFKDEEYILPDGSTPLDGAPTPQPDGEPLPPPMPEPEPLDCSGEILTHIEQQSWFKDCFYIERMGEILTPSGRFMGSTKFNGAYGSKQFIITGEGKLTDEAWKAATRSTLWTVPKVDHIRFLPQRERYEIVIDDMGRKGLNTYVPPRIIRRNGDMSPFFRHMEILFPYEKDRKIIYDYMAHNAKYPGYKIAWAPMIQSTEGTGKGLLIKAAMVHSLGQAYVYYPKAPELIKSGSTFNAWMRSKLMIIVDEIKVDERRELIEILKPMISDAVIEIQSKGVDQDLEDNVANWIFFSNYKNAIPINQNGRRYAIFFTAMQSKADKMLAGLTDAYFAQLSAWMEGGGNAIIANWLWNYQIQRGEIMQEAPDTTSMDEARRISRSPIEVMIENAIEDRMPGFCGGYMSSIAIANRCRVDGIRKPAPETIKTILEMLGYSELGRAPRVIAQENMTERATIFGISKSMPVDGYASAQGYS